MFRGTSSITIGHGFLNIYEILKNKSKNFAANTSRQGPPLRAGGGSWLSLYRYSHRYTCFALVGKSWINSFLPLLTPPCRDTFRVKTDSRGVHGWSKKRRRRRRLRWQLSPSRRDRVCSWSGQTPDWSLSYCHEPDFWETVAGSRSSRFGLAEVWDTARRWILSWDRFSWWRSVCCCPARPRTRCRPCSLGCRTVPSRTVRTSAKLSGAEGRPGVILRCRLNAAVWQCAVPTRAGRIALAGHLRGVTR